LEGQALSVEWVTALVTVATAVRGGGWAVWKWSQDREKTRQLEQKRLGALYVIPFLWACEDLQSRLYNILHSGGLYALRERDPEGRFAEETLYLLAQYFAYEQLILRYTLYGIDLHVLEPILSIRDAFATDRGGIDPWCIFRPTQRRLGRLVLQFRQGEQGTEPDVVPLEDFERQLDTGGGAAVHLEEAVQSLTAADGIDDLPERSRRRLAEVQSHLVDVLEHLEEDMSTRQKPFSLFPGKRRRATSC
jgi:hypothetical protein